MYNEYQKYFLLSGKTLHQLRCLNTIKNTFRLLQLGVKQVTVMRFFTF